MSKDKTYKTLYLDPPWNETGGGKIRRGADRHYPLMKTDAIISTLTGVLLGKVEKNAHIYLWVTNNFLNDGRRVVEALGFRPVSMITWFKGTQINQLTNGDVIVKPEKAGLGQYYRGLTEHCIFGVKGVLPYKLSAEGKRMQGVTGIIAPRGRHSEKPERMYELIETVSHPAYLELFARRERAGWDSWGNEV